MYESFYGLEEKPFNLTPDPKYLFLSDNHKEAFAHLLFGIKNRSGFVMVTGEIGTGKTTICRTLLNQLDDETEVAFIFNTSLSPIELIRKINTEFGIVSEGRDVQDLIDELNLYLLDATRAGKKCVLVVDEAQNLSPAVLEQVRLLSNLETETEKLLQIVLIGQPELAEKLQLHELRQLNQRITARYHLKPLTMKETEQYINYRVHTAGARRKNVFSRGALSSIFRASGGTPRVINAVCDRSLLIGYTKEVPIVGRKQVLQAIKEIKGEKVSARGWTWEHVRDWVPTPKLMVAAVIIILCVLAAQPIVKQFDVSIQRTAVPSEIATAATTTPPPAPATPASAPKPAEEAPVAVPEMPPAPVQVASNPPPVAPEPQVAAPEPVVPAPAPEAAAPATPPAAEPAPAAAPPGAASADAAPVQQAVLPEVLASTDPAAARNEAVKEIFSRWNMAAPADFPPGDTPQDFAAYAQRHGFSQELLNPAMDQLLSIGLPAFVQVQSPDGQRWVALTEAGDNKLKLSSLGAGPVEVSREEFRNHFTGQAMVFWRDPAPQTPILKLGRTGDAVLTLKEQLRRLKRIPQANVSPAYDQETAQAIAKIQAETGLYIDGVTGRQVRMVLGSWAPTTATPSLTPGSAPAPVATSTAPAPAAAPAEPAPKEKSIGKSFSEMLKKPEDKPQASLAPAARDESAQAQEPVPGQHPMPELSLPLSEPAKLAMETAPAAPASLEEQPKQIQVQELPAPRLDELPPLNLEARKETTPPAASGLPLVPHEPGV